MRQVWVLAVEDMQTAGIPCCLLGDGRADGLLISQEWQGPWKQFLRSNPPSVDSVGDKLAGLMHRALFCSHELTGPWQVDMATAACLC